MSKVSNRQMTIVIFLGLVLAIVLIVAWYDGGREDQRLIVQPVELAEDGE